MENHIVKESLQNNEMTPEKMKQYLLLDMENMSNLLYMLRSEPEVIEAMVEALMRVEAKRRAKVTLSSQDMSKFPQA